MVRLMSLIQGPFPCTHHKNNFVLPPFPGSEKCGLPLTKIQVSVKVMTEALLPENLAGFSVVVMVDAPLDDCIA